jgi:hypothetical protein
MAEDTTVDQSARLAGARRSATESLPSTSPFGLPTGYWRHKQQSKMNTRSPFRGGMQVHSVPEAERAFDANGQRLPWAYEYAE